MKILCMYSDGGSVPVRTGWGRVFNYCGHEFRFWKPSEKSAFDAFSECEPDVFLGTTFDLDNAQVKCIAARPQMKVGLYASAWGEYLKGLDHKKYPIVLVNEQEKARLEKLKKETGKPDFVHLHAHGHFLEGTMGGWKEIGIKPVGILNAADLFAFYKGRYRAELSCDWTFVGGYWGYKGVNLSRMLFPMCHPDSGLKGKIFGYAKWPVHNYLGYIEESVMKDLFVSATVCPNVSEPHSTDFEWSADVIERPYKTISSGGFTISDYVPAMRDIFPEDEVPMARTPKEMFDLVHHFVENPDERLPYMDKARSRVISDHTYFSRVATMFAEFGLAAEAAKVIKAKERFLANG